MPKSPGKSYRQIADRVSVRAAIIKNERDGRQLLLDNLLASGSNLVATVQAQVDGVENNPLLLNAIEQHQRATGLMQTLAGRMD